MEKPPEHRWDLLSAALLFILTQVVAARLVATNWAPLLYFTQTLAALGTVLGLALGMSRFRGTTVAIVAAGYSVVLIPWRLVGAVNEAGLWERLMHVAGRLATAYDQFFQRQPVRDSLLFVSFACLVIWLISLAAGYWLTRRSTITGAFVLSGSAIILVQSYADYQARGSWWLAIFFLTALLLAGRIHFLASRRDWSQRRVFSTEESWSDIFSGLALTAAMAVVVAWSIPTTPAGLRSAAENWNKLIRPLRERLSNAVTSLNGPYGTPGGNFYGGTLAIGQNAVSGDSIAFTVEVLRADAPVDRHYWRGRVYQDYAGGKWSQAAAPFQQFDPQQGDISLPDGSASRSEELLSVTNLFPTQSLIYAPSPAVWTDRSAALEAWQAGSGSYDPLSWQTKSVMSAGETYQVKAELANTDLEHLRTAGGVYPAWITDHYLGVPENLRADLRAWAEAASVGRENNYDKAAAITDVLRANLQYSASVPAAPDGQDPVLWVLFDFKKGFCNYYASAEVLLLRSIGIPARLAVGFSQGEYRNGVYTVRNRDAHAWPEVYFPAIGWIEFEPTVSQLPLRRAGEASQGAGLPFVEPRERAFEHDQVPLPAQATGSARPKPTPFSQTDAGRILILLGSIAVGMVTLYAANRSRFVRSMPAYLSRALANSGVSTPAWIGSWDRWNHLEPIERAFFGITWSLRWLGEPPDLDATPQARSAALARLLPSAVQHIEALRSELETGLFTPKPANLSRARAASLVIGLHAVRTRLLNFVRGLDDRDVYSSGSR